MFRKRCLSALGAKVHNTKGERMSEIEKPWSQHKNAYEWYMKETRKEITVRLDKKHGLALIQALASISQTLEDGQIELALERLNLLGELLIATATDNPTELIEETIVAIEMSNFDQKAKLILEQE